MYLYTCQHVLKLMKVSYKFWFGQSKLYRIYYTAVSFDCVEFEVWFWREVKETTYYITLIQLISLQYQKTNIQSSI